MKKILLSWSSGKDSAWALHQLQQRPDIQVLGLFTTVNREYQRVAMHAVRVELLKMQAQSLGLPLEMIYIPNPCSNEDYEKVMGAFVSHAKEMGVDGFAFGDLFLEDIRAYRESNLEGTGMEAIFPLWGSDTRQLSQEMLAGGLKARLTCVNPKQLDPSFCGRDYDRDFLADLPESVDVCGENGEFHTFAYDGPMFKFPVPIRTGDTILRDGFAFTDLSVEQNRTFNHAPLQPQAYQA